MSDTLMAELLRRRVPQVMGVYLAAGWGLLEFTDWAVGRFEASSGVTDVVIGERNPVLIAAPPGVYHGWMSLEDDTQLIGIASETYNRQDPDEERLPPDHFGDVWTIKGR